VESCLVRGKYSTSKLITAFNFKMLAAVSPALLLSVTTLNVTRKMRNIKWFT